jgi:hypothetical protein
VVQHHIGPRPINGLQESQRIVGLLQTKVARSYNKQEHFWTGEKPGVPCESAAEQVMQCDARSTFCFDTGICCADGADTHWRFLKLKKYCFRDPFSTTGTDIVVSRENLAKLCSALGLLVP